MSIRRWIKSGELKAYRTPGGHHRIFRGDLVAYLRRKNIPIADNSPIPKRKILIVDDDAIVREGIFRYLSSFPNEFEIMTARDGFEAGVGIIQFLPDIVLLDLMMPHVDGFNICSQIRGNPTLKDVRIIVLTGFGSEENIVKAYQAGANRVLCKPLRSEEILSEIRMLA